MSYIEKTMMTGEKLVYRAKLHWIIFFWPAFFLFCAFMYGMGGSPETAAVFTLIALLLGTRSFILYATSEFGVTNKRVILKAGLIRRSTVETMIAKVEGVAVDQGILGRLFGYGAVSVTGTGGTRGAFSKIAAPLEFRKQIQETIDGLTMSQPTNATRAVPQ